MRGGYQLINFNHKALTTGGAAVTISGVYEAIEGNYCKTLVATNLTLDTADLNDTPVNFTASSGNFVGVLNSTWGAESVTAQIITVTEDDEITITNITITSA